MMSQSLTQVNRQTRKDALAARFLGVLSLSAASLLLLIILFLCIQAWPVMQLDTLLQFVKSDGWHPLEGKLGMLPMFWATLAAGIG